MEKKVNPKEAIPIKTFCQKGKNFIHFFFRGKFSYQAAIGATQAWKAHYDHHPDRKFIHIWDCQNMSGFENKAKNLWLAHMNAYFHQTERIIMVSDSLVIRGTARLMSKLSKHHLNVYKTFAEMSRQELHE